MAVELHTDIVNGKTSDACREQIIATLKLLEGKRVAITIEEVKDKKTSSQLKYVHVIINNHLTDVLHTSGNIEANSIHLAKEWIKEYCGYGETRVFKFKGKERERFISESFANIEKEGLSEIIEAIVRICAMVGVIVSVPGEFA